MKQSVPNLLIEFPQTTVADNINDTRLLTEKGTEYQTAHMNAWLLINNHLLCKSRCPCPCPYSVLPLMKQLLHFQGSRLAVQGCSMT